MFLGNAIQKNSEKKMSIILSSNEKTRKNTINNSTKKYRTTIKNKILDEIKVPYIYSKSKYEGYDSLLKQINGINVESKNIFTSPKK